MRPRSNPKFGGGEVLTDRLLSVSEIIASLEEQLALHREQEGAHAEREAFHRGQRETHAAEIEALTRRLDEFRAASAAALDLALRAPSSSPAPVAPVKEEDYGPASRPKVVKMVRRILTDLGPNRGVGASWIAFEINRRFGDRLRKEVSMSQVSTILRRLRQKGVIRLQTDGRPHHEARYVLPQMP